MRTAIVFNTGRGAREAKLGTPARSEVRGPGRPRDPNLESRVFAAVRTIYAEAGWSGFSFDAVARSAGVGKAPLYLRWKTKEDLLLSSTGRSCSG
jgi:AcrR family transcriptional regulator